LPEPLPDDLADALARAASRLAPFGRRVLWFPTIGSTNDVAASLADAGEPEGTVVVADAQTAGRGRHGRVWISPPAAGLYTSVILRPPAEALDLVTLTAGVALADGLRAATGIDTSVKWPNDIYVHGRKVAGILAEGGASAVGASHVVLGFGINLLPAALPPAVASRATALETELGREVDRGLVFAECLAAVAHRYGQLRRGERAAILADWRTRARSTFGRGVEWDGPDGRCRGVAEDVDGGGALLVRTASGRERLLAGEVRWTS
jgi:BirA family transcriptional regulator, biotin operon repressor / biotin---[acetyl-CoA-carboxylase] ligase